MASISRRPIGSAQVGAQAPAPDKAKAEDVITPADPATPPDPVGPASPENVEPVDTDSPEYKSGYQLGVDRIDTGSPDFQAGYAAGLGASPAPAPVDPPADQMAEPAASVPAKSYDLIAAFPDDKGFCMDYLADCDKTGAVPTISGAKARYADVLVPKLKAANARAAEAERKLAEETGSPAPARLKKNDAAPEPAAPDDPKAAAAAEWDADPKVRVGFSSKSNYVAYRAAEISGQVRTMRMIPQ